MNCFNHPSVPSVGSCKYCHKGLCPECAVDLGYGIACANHRLEVTALKEINHGEPYNSQRHLQVAAIRHRFVSLALVFFTVALTVLGFLIGGVGKYLFIFMGILSLVFSIISAVDANVLIKAKGK